MHRVLVRRTYAWPNKRHDLALSSKLLSPVETEFPRKEKRVPSGPLRQDSRRLASGGRGDFTRSTDGFSSLRSRTST